MFKYILKDKFSFPVSFTIFWGIFQYKNYHSNWTFALAILIMIIILCLISCFKTDNYVQKILNENEAIIIQYQKNFLKDKPNSFSTNLNTIKSYKFHSKSFLNFNHIISIKYIDEDNLHYKITFKTNNDDDFINLIYQLNKTKAEQQQVTNSIIDNSLKT